jgi:hypothetical protein
VYLEEADVYCAAIWVVVHRVVVSGRRGLSAWEARDGTDVVRRLDSEAERDVLTCVGGVLGRLVVLMEFL